MALISPTQISDGTTIDASDVNNPINTIANEFNGNVDNANIKAAAAIAGSKIADASIDLGLKGSSFDGWISVTDSWTYASATTITVPSNATAKYSVGDKIRLVQSATTKYFEIQTVAATLITIADGGGSTLTNSAISSIYYSKVTNPLGFSGPANPYKVSAYKSTDQASVASGTKITFDTEIFDTNSNFASSTYTIPVSGFYWLNSEVYISSLNATARVQLYKNGSVFRSGKQTYGLSDVTSSFCGFVQLTAGDTLDIYLTFSGGGTRTVIGEASVAGRPTLFEGFLVSRT